MPICSKCKTSQEIQEGLWNDVPYDQVPCSQCKLSESSLSTFQHNEDHIANSSRNESPDDEVWTREEADRQSPQPYAILEGNEEDPLVPLSKLVEVMQLWTRLSLPARKTIQMRMAGLPFSEIGKRLGFSRQMAEKLVSKAIAEDSRLHNLLPSKKVPLSATRNSAIADGGKVPKNRITVSHKPHFVKHCETQTA